MAFVSLEKVPPILIAIEQYHNKKGRIIQSSLRNRRTSTDFSTNICTHIAKPSIFNPQYSRQSLLRDYVVFVHCPFCYVTH